MVSLPDRESIAKPRLQADGLPVISLDVKHSEAQHIRSGSAVQPSCSTHVWAAECCVLSMSK